MKKFIIGIIVLFLVSVILVGCGSKDERITVYIGFQEDHAVESMKRFTEDTGIEVDMIRMSGGEILAKIRAEKDNPQASVWYGGPADTFVAAQQEDLLQPYFSPIAEEIDERYKDPDGYWSGIYLGVLGFGTDQAFLDKHGIEAPKSWEDLLDPVFENEIIMAHPGSSGTAYAILYTILQVMGSEEAGFDYLEKLHGQVQQYTTSGSAPGRMVGMGEAGVSILFAHDIVKWREEGFDNLVVTIPEDGTGYEIGAVAMIKNAPNEETAKKFIDWTLSPRAQEIGQTVGGFQNLTHPEAKDPELAIDMDSVKLVDYDTFKAGSERSRLVERWNTEINN